MTMVERCRRGRWDEIARREERSDVWKPLIWRRSFLDMRMELIRGEDSEGCVIWKERRERIVISKRGDADEAKEKVRERTLDETNDAASLDESLSLYP